MRPRRSTCSRAVGILLLSRWAAAAAAFLPSPQGVGALHSSWRLPRLRSTSQRRPIDGGGSAAGDDDDLDDDLDDEATPWYDDPWYDEERRRRQQAPRKRKRQSQSQSPESRWSLIPPPLPRPPRPSRPSRPSRRSSASRRGEERSADGRSGSGSGDTSSNRPPSVAAPRNNRPRTGIGGGGGGGGGRLGGQSRRPGRGERFLRFPDSDNDDDDDDDDGDGDFFAAGKRYWGERERAIDDEYDVFGEQLDDMDDDNIQRRGGGGGQRRMRTGRRTRRGGSGAFDEFDEFDRSSSSAYGGRYDSSRGYYGGNGRYGGAGDDLFAEGLVDEEELLGLTEEPDQALSDRWEKWGAHCEALPPPPDPAAPLPLGVVHLIGGAVVGITPRLSYDGLCEGLARRGFLVIATPLAADSMRIGSIWNHHRLARAAAEDFREAWGTVEERYGPRAAAKLRLFGVGHSLGAKLQLLLCSDPELRAIASPVPRAANVLVAYNNFAAAQSVPLLQELRDAYATTSSFLRRRWDAYEEGSGTGGDEEDDYYNYYYDEDEDDYDYEYDEGEETTAAAGAAAAANRRTRDGRGAARGGAVPDAGDESAAATEEKKVAAEDETEGIEGKDAKEEEEEEEEEEEKEATGKDMKGMEKEDAEDEEDEGSVGLAMEEEAIPSFDDFFDRLEKDLPRKKDNDNGDDINTDYDGDGAMAGKQQRNRRRRSRSSGSGGGSTASGSSRVSSSRRRRRQPPREGVEGGRGLEGVSWGEQLMRRRRRQQRQQRQWEREGGSSGGGRRRTISERLDAFLDSDFGLSEDYEDEDEDNYYDDDDDDDDDDYYYGYGEYGYDGSRGRGGNNDDDDEDEDYLGVSSLVDAVVPVLGGLSEIVAGAAEGAADAARKSRYALVREGAELVDDRVLPLAAEAASAMQGALTVEFQPSPEELEAMVLGVQDGTNDGTPRSEGEAEGGAGRRDARRRSKERRGDVGGVGGEFGYSVEANLLVQFASDGLDQTPRIAELLTRRFEKATSSSGKKAEKAQREGEEAASATTTTTRGADDEADSSSSSSSSSSSPSRGGKARGGGGQVADDFEFFTATPSSSGWAPSANANDGRGSREGRGSPGGREGLNGNEGSRGFGYDGYPDDDYQANGASGVANGVNGMDIMDTIAMDMDLGRAGKNSNALRQFWRLPGNHGTPNDLNPGDTYIDEETLRKRKQQAARRNQRGSPPTTSNSPSSSSAFSSSSSSSSSSPSLAEVKAGTTVEIAMLADVISTYLTDRALWRR